MTTPHVSDRPCTPADARENCLDWLAEAYERFAVREQELRNQRGKEAEAEGAHRYALWVLRAYEAEQRP